MQDKPTDLFNEFNQLIGEGDNILIITHKNPDGDGLGSMLALYWTLIPKNKIVSMGCIDEVPIKLSFLPGSELINKNFNCYEYDTIITVDAGNNIARIGIPDDLLENTINIDHHSNDSASFGKLNIIDKNRCSTSEIILDLLIFLNYPVTKDIANCLLTGIFTDTNGFQNANISHTVLESAAKLMLKGARLDKIAFHSFENKSIATLKIWGRALARIHKDTKNGMVTSIITKRDLEECGATIEDLTGLSSIINTVSDSKFTVLLTEYDINRVKASLRSEEYKGVDVSEIAREFQGGGHKLASGFEIHAGIKETIKLINERLNELRKDKVNIANA